MAVAGGGADYGRRGRSAGRHEQAHGGERDEADRDRRERREEVAPLLKRFVERYSRKVGKRFATIDRQSILRCEEYPWPGNVRELENLVERSVILCPEPVFFLNPFAQGEATAPGAAHTTLDALVRAHIIRALKLCEGRIYGGDGAARLLGLKPSTLQSKLKRLGIDRGSLS